jgi:type II secretory pathway component PulF
MVNMWGPVAILAFLVIMAAFAIAHPKFRNILRWKTPAFREAGLAQISSVFALTMENGCSFSESLGLVVGMERGTPAGSELSQWQKRLAEGETKFSQLTSGGRVFPPLFVWTIEASREDWLAGFKHAAQLFHERAVRRTEMLILGVLPCTVLLLGVVILLQVVPLARFIGGLATPFDITPE